MTYKLSKTVTISVVFLLIIILNKYFIGISIWYLDLNLKTFDFLLILFLIFQLCFLKKIFIKSKAAGLLSFSVFLGLLIFSIMRFTFAPVLEKVDTINTSPATKFEAYQIKNDDTYTFIQRNKLLYLLSVDRCIYQYSHFSNEFSWELTSEGSIQINGESVETSKGLFSSLSCPE